MEKMKKRLEKRVWLMWAGFMVLTGLSAYDSLGPGLPLGGQVNEHILSFQHGLRFGGMMMLLAFILRYTLALRNEERLKALYYQVTDERMAMVRLKAGAPVMLACAIAMLAGSLVAMYLNTAVSLTLIGCAVFLLLVTVVGKAVWSARLNGGTGE